MRNPDKFLRQGYLVALSNQALIAFNKDIPPSVNPIPSQYVLIESQSKNTTERSKNDFEWNARIILHIISINQRGYTATTFIDDAEEKCINAIEQGIIVNNFYLKSAYLIDSNDLDMTDKTTTIERRVLIYEHWLAEIGSGNVEPVNPASGILTPPFTPIVIPAGTLIPYFLPIAGKVGYDKTSEVVTEIMWVNPSLGVSTNQLVRIYDMPAVQLDSNGDGTGTFIGWAIYGHQGLDSTTFLENTYVTLK